MNGVVCSMDSFELPNEPENVVPLPNAAPRAERPQVEIPGTSRSLGDFADEAGSIIGPKQCWFLKGNQIVELRQGSAGSNAPAAYFHVLSASEARTALELHMITGRWMAAQDTRRFVSSSISQQTAQGLLDANQFRNHLPRIERILTVPLPLIERENLVFTETGYDSRFRTYCPESSPAAVEMSLEEAKQIFDEMLGEFCFQDETSRTISIARILTPYCRGLMGFQARGPLWIFEANRPRAGKDYLNACALILYEGQAREDGPVGSNSEETDKRIIAAALAGRRFMHFANSRGHINNPALEQAITAQLLSSRLLGSNDARSDIQAANEIDFSLSANSGYSFTEDLSLRSRRICLVYYDEDANGRVFRNGDLHQWIQERRNLILGAMAAFVQHWHQAGMPSGPTAFTSFPQWSRVVGGIMAACELGDPCVPQPNNGVSGDTNTEDMRTLYRLAHAAYPDRPASKSEILALIRDHDDVEMFSWFEPENRGHQTRLGKLIRSFDGRTLGGVVMSVDARDKSRPRFRFVAAAPTSRISPPSTGLCTPCEPCEPDLDEGGRVLPESMPPIREGTEVREVSNVRNQLLALPVGGANSSPEGEAL